MAMTSRIVHLVILDVLATGFLFCGKGLIF